jgi:hypothetical protein
MITFILVNDKKKYKLSNKRGLGLEEKKIKVNRLKIREHNGLR